MQKGTYFWMGDQVYWVVITGDYKLSSFRCSWTWSPVMTTWYRRVGARTFYLSSARRNVLITVRRVRTSHLGLARKNVQSRTLRALTLSRDGTFLRAEPRWDVLTRRAEMGRSFAPSWDGTFLISRSSTLHEKR